MDLKIQILITILLLIAITLSFYLITKAITNLTGYSIALGFNPEEEKIILAKCLSEKGARVYLSSSCFDCQKQEELFSSSFQYITSVKCEGENSFGLCTKKGIQDYPTWEINNQLYFGVKSLNELSQLSGCSYKKEEVKIEKIS